MNFINLTKSKKKFKKKKKKINMKIKGNNGGDQAKLKSNLIKSEINTKQSPRNEIGISKRERESQTSDLVLMWLTSAATPGVPAIS